MYNTLWSIHILAGSVILNNPCLYKLNYKRCILFLTDLSDLLIMKKPEWTEISKCSKCLYLLKKILCKTKGTNKFHTWKLIDFVSFSTCSKIEVSAYCPFLLWVPNKISLFTALATIFRTVFCHFLMTSFDFLLAFHLDWIIGTNNNYTQCFRRKLHMQSCHVLMNMNKLVLVTEFPVLTTNNNLRINTWHGKFLNQDWDVDSPSGSANSSRKNVSRRLCSGSTRMISSFMYIAMVNPW